MNTTHSNTQPTNSGAAERLRDRLFSDTLAIDPGMFEAARIVLKDHDWTGGEDLERAMRALLQPSSLHRTTIGQELKAAATIAGLAAPRLVDLRASFVAEVLRRPTDAHTLARQLNEPRAWRSGHLATVVRANKIGVHLEESDVTWLSDMAVERIAAGERIDTDDPSSWRPSSKRWVQVLAARIGVASHDSEDLSHHALRRAMDSEPVDIQDPYAWRLGSRAWGTVMDNRYGPLDGEITEPIGLIVVPHPNGQDAGWQTRPVFSVPMLRLLLDCGYRVDRYLQSAQNVDLKKLRQLTGRLDTDWLDSGSEDRQQVFGRLGVQLQKRTSKTAANDWASIRPSLSDQGRVLYVATRSRKALPTRRFGAGLQITASPRQRIVAGWSAAQELGELVAAASSVPLPVVLSSEAASELDGVTRVGRMKGLPGALTITSIDTGEVTTRTLPARRAAATIAGGKLPGDVRVSRDAAMVMRMAAARPLTDDPVLFAPQQQVAAVQAVGSGVNASQVGTGKTIMTGRALHAAAMRTQRYRGLIAVPSGLVTQWVRQLTEGHHAIGQPLCPGVEVLVVDHSDQHLIRKLRGFHRQLGEQPGIVVVSHETVTLRSADLCTLGWHHLIVDEAHHATNPAAELHVALLQLRTTAVGDAWMLTGTPKGKSTADLDVLVGLAFGDPEMISGRLASRLAGDTLDERNADRLMAAYGPAIQRVRKSDMQAYMPKVRPAKPYRLDPDPDTAALLKEIRTGGREAYQRMRQMLREVQVLRDRGEVTGELYDQAMSEMRKAQSQVLSNVGVLFDASVDVETLRFSQAQLAQELAGSDELERACNASDGLPLLRAVASEQVVAACEDTPVVVAATRVRCLRLMQETLTDRHGVSSAVLAGDCTRAEIDESIRRFEQGDHQVLLLGPVAQTGFDLQHAGAMCHLDLPWTPTPLSQRLGRIERPGSQHSELHQWIPYLAGGLIPHVVGLLAPRAAEAHNLLDGISGVAGRDTAEGAALGEIAAEAVAAKQEEGQEQTAARLAVAASVFG